VKDHQKKVAEILSNDASVEFAYLFGSRATGRSDAGSDWDIAVFYKEKIKTVGWRRFYQEAKISRILGAEVQITVLNGLDSPLLLFEILSKGILIVDNAPDRRIVFESRSLAAHYDWQHFEKRHVAR
jgi:predicted nucleotidyltransferase